MVSVILCIRQLKQPAPPASGIGLCPTNALTAANVANSYKHVSNLARLFGPTFAFAIKTALLPIARRWRVGRVISNLSRIRRGRVSSIGRGPGLLHVLFAARPVGGNRLYRGSAG